MLNNHAVKHGTTSRQATLPRIVTFRRLGLGEYDLSAGILLLAELVLFTIFSTSMTVDWLPGLLELFGVGNLSGLSSGIGLFGRSN